MKYNPRESTIIDVEHCLRGEIMSLSMGHRMDFLACDLLKKVNPEAFNKLLETRIQFNNACSAVRRYSRSDYWLQASG
jgi:hypothetical protein